jgi:hypothetical protein
MSALGKLISGVYKDGIRVQNYVSSGKPTRMDNFGTYDRVTRPGNVPGWFAPSRLEARKARKTGDSNYDFSDQMERGEPQLHVPTSALRGHIRTHLKNKGIKHTPRTGEPRGTSSFYAPKGGDLDAKTVTNRRTFSKEQLLKLRRTKGGSR